MSSITFPSYTWGEASGCKGLQRSSLGLLGLGIAQQPVHMERQSGADSHMRLPHKNPLLLLTGFRESPSSLPTPCWDTLPPPATTKEAGVMDTHSSAAQAYVRTPGQHLLPAKCYAAEDTRPLHGNLPGSGGDPSSTFSSQWRLPLRHVSSNIPPFSSSNRQG